MNGYDYHEQDISRPAVSPRALEIVTNTISEREDVLRRCHGNALGRHKDLVHQQLVELNELHRLLLSALVKES